ncbi:hypothetical protein AB0G85_12575 [Streptomyces sioyaensis]|uniref:hypothetical protein n=1 Tax=Streptomyces sioyaensis TaxID=67364 RepID=UPI0033D3DEE8
MRQPLRRAVEWLAGTVRRHDPAKWLPAAAAAAHAAEALGEPELTRPLLLDFSERLADADAAVWQAHGMGAGDAVVDAEHRHRLGRRAPRPGPGRDARWRVRVVRSRVAGSRVAGAVTGPVGTARTAGATPGCIAAG